MNRKFVRICAVALVAGLGSLQVAGAVTINSDFCKNWYNEIKKKPGKRAMALSTDGKVCHSVWGEGTQADADRKAVAGCQENNERKCSVVRR